MAEKHQTQERVVWAKWVRPEGEDRPQKVRVQEGCDGDDLTEPIADAGRFVLGSESFRVLRTRAGRDLVIVMRTRTPAAVRFLRAQGPIETTVALAETALEVRAGGRVAARVRLANRDGWNEHVLRVPAAFVTEGGTDIRLAGRHASYRYWFYQ